jgi:hypothetical protein
MKSSGYPYPSEEFLPKSERRTAMANRSDGIPVERVELPDHFSTEPDNTALYIPKGMEYSTSMAKTRFQLPQCDGPVRSHAIVVLTKSAIIIDRQRSWKMLHTMAAAGDEQAVAVLKALSGFTLD